MINLWFWWFGLYKIWCILLLLVVFLCEEFHTHTHTHTKTHILKNICFHLKYFVFLVGLWDCWHEYFPVVFKYILNVVIFHIILEYILCCKEVNLVDDFLTKSLSFFPLFHLMVFLPLIINYISWIFMTVYCICYTNILLLSFT